MWNPVCTRIRDARRWHRRHRGSRIEHRVPIADLARFGGPLAVPPHAMGPWKEESMTAAQRKIHLAVWLVLGPVLLALVMLALLKRPGT